MSENLKDRIKVGYHAEQDGTFTSFVQFKYLPTEDAARNACQWLADTLIEVSKPKNTIIQ